MYLNLNIHTIISKQKNINIYTRISYIKVLRPWQTYKLYTYICIYVSGLVKGRFCTRLLCGLTAKWGQGRWPHKGLNVQPALWRSDSNSLWAKHVCTTSHWQVANKHLHVHRAIWNTHHVNKAPSYEVPPLLFGCAPPRPAQGKWSCCKKLPGERCKVPKLCWTPRQKKRETKTEKKTRNYPLPHPPFSVPPPKPSIAMEFMFRSFLHFQAPGAKNHLHSCHYCMVSRCMLQREIWRQWINESTIYIRMGYSKIAFGVSFVQKIEHHSSNDKMFK